MPPHDRRQASSKGSTKVYDAPSVFTAANLLREARRQRHLPAIPLARVCLLDPDGDVVDHLRAAGAAQRHPRRGRCGYPGAH